LRGGRNKDKNPYSFKRRRKNEGYLRRGGIWRDHTEGLRKNSKIGGESIARTGSVLQKGTKKGLYPKNKKKRTQIIQYGSSVNRGDWKSSAAPVGGKKAHGKNPRGAVGSIVEGKKRFSSEKKKGGLRKFPFSWGEGS